MASGQQYLAPTGASAKRLSGDLRSFRAPPLPSLRALERRTQWSSIDKLSVVLVAVFGEAFLGEQLTLTSRLGVLLIGGGAVLIALG